TIVNGSTIGLGSSVYDTAQLGNGGGFGFTGSVTYKFYSGTPAASGDCTSGGALVGTADPGVSPSGCSSSHGTLAAGHYFFTAPHAQSRCGWSSFHDLHPQADVPDVPYTTLFRSDDRQWFDDRVGLVGVRHGPARQRWRLRLHRQRDLQVLFGHAGRER